MTKAKVGRWHQLAWWLCVITLPWNGIANNICLILLVLIWIIEGDFNYKWRKLKEASWSWPFLGYYLLLVVGMIYTNDAENGLFALNKKIVFFILPIVAASESCFDEKFFQILKRSFVYSCLGVILLCLAVATYFYLSGGPVANFDFSTYDNFKSIHPDASPAWMHFTYIQFGYWADFHPAYLSMYLVFCLVILLTENYREGWERSIHILIGLLMVFCLALLASRMAIIAFTGAAIYLGLKKIQERHRWTFVLIVSFSFILAAFLWVNPVARFRLVEEPMITTYQSNQSVTNWNSVSYRLLEWEGSWSVIRAHWFGGVGTGGGKRAMADFYAHYNSSTVGLALNAHNQYLQTWMESGFTRVIRFFTLLGGGPFTIAKDPSYVCFIIIFSLMCMTESIGERQKGIVFFTLFQVLFLGFEKNKA